MMGTQYLILCHFLCLFVFSVALKTLHRACFTTISFLMVGIKAPLLEKQTWSGRVKSLTTGKKHSPYNGLGGSCVSCFCLPELSGFTFVSPGMPLKKRSFYVCQCTHSSALMGITFRKSRLIPDQNCQCNQQILFWMCTRQLCQHAVALFKNHDSEIWT